MVGAETASCRNPQRDRRRHDQAAVVVDMFSDEVCSAGSEEESDLIVRGTVEVHELPGKEGRHAHGFTSVCSNLLHAAARAGAVSSTRRGLHAAHAPISEDA